MGEFKFFKNLLHLFCVNALRKSWAPSFYKLKRHGATTSLSGGALCFGAQLHNSEKSAHWKVTDPLRAHLFWKAARQELASYDTKLSDQRHILLAACASDVLGRCALKIL